MEVECRTCLEMADLETSSGITKKFLLGKSYKEVILLFVPQMVSAIWGDDIICCTCSKTLHAFAKIIGKCLATEIVLIKKSMNQVTRNRKVPGRLNQNTLLNTTLFESNTEHVPPDPSNKNIRLQPRPIHELCEPSVRHRLNKTRVEPTNVGKCGVCLREMSNSEFSFSFTQQLLLGRTFKEVILTFLPFMVSEFWINDLICFLCANSFFDFAKFIERCIEIEEIFEKVNGKKEAEKAEEVDSNKKKKELTQHLREHPNQSTFNYNKPIRTYVRKPKSVKQNTAQPQTVALPKTEISTGPIETNTAVSDANETPVDMKESQIHSDMSTIFIDLDSIAKSLDTTHNKQVEQITQQRRCSSKDVTVINSPTADSVEREESTNPIVPTLVAATKAGQISSDKSTINNSIAKPLDNTDKEPVVLREQRNCNTSVVASATECSLIESVGSESDASCGGTDDDLELLAEEENGAIDITERFNVRGVPFCNYPIRRSDRIISIPQSKTVLPGFLQAMSTNLNIPIYHYGKPPADMTNKRVLLLGLAAVPCPICRTIVNSVTLNQHLKCIHNQLETPELPRASVNTPSIGYIIRSTRKKDLPAVEDRMLYVYENVLKAKKGRNRHPCPVCNKVIDTVKEQAAHLHRVHKDFKAFTCDKCGKKFGYKNGYVIHMAKYRTYASCHVKKCSVCSDIVDKANFAKHMKEHKMFTCDECGACYSSAALLRQHSKKHQNQQNKNALKPLQLCSVCGATPTNLRCHMKTHEARPRTYKCHTCHKAYMSQHSLNSHIKKSHQNREFICNVCNKICRTATALTAHNKLKHLKVVSHVCKICGAKFARGDYFRRHMKMHAEGKRRFRGPRKYVYASHEPVEVECKYCLKICRSVSMLKLHLMSHMKRMRYKCRFCSLSFSNAANRLRHEKKHNDPNFEFRCKICWCQLFSKEELETHLEKHEKTRKYKCQYCEEAYSRKYLLHHHIAEKHTSIEDIEEEKQAIYSNALQELILDPYDDASLD